MKDIAYSAHARRRMHQRGVSEQDVQVTLAHPDEVCETPENSFRYTRTMADGRTLKVWTVRPEQPSRVVVKSVAWKGEQDVR